MRVLKRDSQRRRNRKGRPGEGGAGRGVMQLQAKDYPSTRSQGKGVERPVPQDLWKECDPAEFREPPWIQTSGLQNWENKFCCSYHQICGNLLQQPQDGNTPAKTQWFVKQEIKGGREISTARIMLLAENAKGEENLIEMWTQDLWKYLETVHFWKMGIWTLRPVSSLPGGRDVTSVPL